MWRPIYTFCLFSPSQMNLYNARLVFYFVIRNYIIAMAVAYEFSLYIDKTVCLQDCLVKQLYVFIMDTSIIRLY